MTPFDKLVGWIKDEEGFVDHVYDDGYGNLTIGYGDTRPEILKKYRKGITEAEATVVLGDLLRTYWSAVADLVRPGTTDNQMVAFTSLAYNIGIGGLSGSTTLQRHNNGDSAGAAEALLWWNKAENPSTGQLVVSEGLVRRRQREYDLYLAGDRPKPLPLVNVGELATIKLVSLNSALPLDVAGESHENGASIIQYHGHSRWNQEWSLAAIPDGNPGEVAIVASHSGKVMDVAEYSTENGARVQQWDYHGGANQRWRVFAKGNLLQFQNVHSGKFLDVRGGSVDAGADLIQYDGHDQDNQIFMRVRMERLSTINPVTEPPTPLPDSGQPPSPVEPDFDVGAALRGLGGFPGEDEDGPISLEENVYGFQTGFSFWPLVADGVAGPETVRAIKYSQQNGGRCGKYFTFAEFGCRHCGRCRIMAFHVSQMDQYRERVGPVTIISGTRCDKHNRAVGGATNSQHRPHPNNRGVSTACDIPGAVDVDTLSSWKLFSGEGYVPSEGNIVVHVDSRGDGPNNTTGGSRERSTRWSY